MQRTAADLVCLHDGCAAPWYVLELVFLCDRAGIRLNVVDEDVIATSDNPATITDALREDLRRVKPGVREILLHLPGDSPDRRF